MTIQAKAGTFTAAGTWGAASTHDITGLGFQPSLVLFFDLGSALDAVGADLFAFLGMSDGVNNVAAGSHARDGVAASAVAKSLRTDVCYYYYTSSAGARGSFSCAMLADGFRLTVATTFSSFARQIGYLAIGGLTNAKVGSGTFPAGTGTFNTTGLGFQPDGLIAAMPNEATVPDADGFTGGLSFGAATATAQACMAWSAQNGQNPSNNRSRWNTAALISQLTPSADTVEIEAALSAFIADGFTLNKTVGSRTDGFIWAAFKGGNPVLSVESTRTSAGDVVRSGLSVAPAGLLLFSPGHAAASEAVPTPNARYGVGAASAGAQFAVSAVSADNITPTDAAEQNATNRCLLRTDRTAADTFAAGSALSLASLDADGYTLTQSTLDAAAHQFAVLALGESAAPATDDDPANTTADVPASQLVGTPRTITVTARKSDGTPMAVGGAVVAVTITGVNPSSPAVTDVGNGTYTYTYATATIGADSHAITIDGVAISGSPYACNVVAGGAGGVVPGLSGGLISA